MHSITLYQECLCCVMQEKRNVIKPSWYFQGVVWGVILSINGYFQYLAEENVPFLFEENSKTFPERLQLHSGKSYLRLDWFLTWILAGIGDRGYWVIKSIKITIYPLYTLLTKSNLKKYVLILKIISYYFMSY